jgi:ABC-type nitrate/sulfonate/bicarbonate transport system permease component
MTAPVRIDGQTAGAIGAGREAQPNPLAGPAPARAARWVSREHPLLWRLLSVALFLGAWEIAGRIPINFAFPPFSEVFEAFLRMMADGSMVAAYAETLKPLVIGVVISAVLGVAIGVAMGLSRMSEWLVAPVFIVLQAAPMAALVPLLTFVYGIGLLSKTLAVILLALPVIARRQMILKIILPAASPVIFAGSAARLRRRLSSA